MVEDRQEILRYHEQTRGWAYCVLLESLSARGELSGISFCPNCGDCPINKSFLEGRGFCSDELRRAIYLSDLRKNVSDTVGFNIGVPATVALLHEARVGGQVLVDSLARLDLTEGRSLVAGLNGAVSSYYEKSVKSRFPPPQVYDFSGHTPEEVVTHSDNFLG